MVVKLLWNSPLMNIYIYVNNLNLIRRITLILKSKVGAERQQIDIDKWHNIFVHDYSALGKQ